MKAKLIVTVFMVLVSTFLKAQSTQNTENYVLTFLKNNPERSSVVFTRNDTTLAAVRSDKKLPLASTVKIIIAIEYAQQVAEGKVNPEEEIPLSTIDKFYIANTDGNAHPDWLADMRSKNLIAGEKVKLENIAKGMIRYSSNANTEFLMEKLGFDNINANLKKLNLPNHDSIYPFVASLFLFSNSKNVNPQQFLSELQNMPMAEYLKKSMDWHERLKSESNSKFKNNFVFPSMDLQRIWSDRLPAATTQEYVSIMQKVNSRKYFDEKTQQNIEKLLEWPLEYNPANTKSFEHLGQKGGSTAFVLTQSMYATLKNGKKMEMAIFFNDLTNDEFNKLQKAMNDFILSCISAKSCYEVAKQLKDVK